MTKNELLQSSHASQSENMSYKDKWIEILHIRGNRTKKAYGKMFNLTSDFLQYKLKQHSTS